MEELFKVLEPEIPVRSTELSADKAVAAADLKRTLGTLRYLQSLKAEQERKAAAALSPQKVGHAAADGVAGDGPAEEAMADVVGADACPVCHEPFGTELVMLSCGHRLCCKCQLAMVEQLPASQPAATKRIGCPTCRSRVPLSEIAYIVAPEPGEGEDVDLTKETDGASPSGRGEAAWARDGGVKVQGSYGTKLEAVVRRLVSITRSDSGARVLVFSSWKDSLELLAHALTANGLPHIFPRSSKHFEAAVAQFRAGHEAFMAAANGASSSTAPTPAVHRDAPRVLLLLLKQGGNGLNLQQAQHVVFIEPVLDPAEEAQAMGRVDRIGQTHATHVHRFVVTHSVEENVHKLGQYRAAAMDMSAAAVRRGKAGGDRGALTVRDVAALLAEDGNHHRHVE